MKYQGLFWNFRATNKSVRLWVIGLDLTVHVVKMGWEYSESEVVSFLFINGGKDGGWRK